ncbi:MAG: hypothetical protein ABUK11_01925 [Mariprofundaceae bacterium]
MSILASIILGWFIFATLATKILHRGLHGKRRPVMVRSDSFKRSHTHHR